MMARCEDYQDYLGSCRTAGNQVIMREPGIARVAQELEAVLGRLGGLQGRQLTWLGGLANHQDAFGPLARMLLVLHCAGALDLAPGQLLPASSEGSGHGTACAQPPTDGGQGAGPIGSAVEALRRCVQGFLRMPLQPLLGNMLVQVCCACGCLLPWSPDCAQGCDRSFQLCEFMARHAFKLTCPTLSGKVGTNSQKLSRASCR